MQLSLAGEQQLVGLRVAGVVDRGILLVQPVHRAADLVLVAAALRLDRVRQHGLRELDFGDLHLRALLREHVIGARVLQLRDRAEIACLQFRYLRLRLALQHQEVAEPLRAVARLVMDVAVLFERAGGDAQHRDATGERVGNRLPHERGVRRGVGRLDAGRLAARVNRRKLALGRRRDVGDDRVEQRLDPDHVESGRADERENLPGDRGRAQPLCQLLLREGALREERLHQPLVGLGHHLDQLFAGARRPLDQRRGHVALGHLAAAVGGKCQRLHAYEVDDTREPALLADRELDRDDLARAVAVQRLERALQARALAFQPVDGDDARKVE